MMKHFLFFVSLCMSLILHGQEQWQTYASLHDISDVETFGDETFVCNRGGLYVINNLTQEEILLTPSNSSLKGYGTDEIVFLANGDAWVASSEAGILYYDGQDFDLRGPKTEKWARNYNLKVYNDVLWFFSDTADGRRLFSYRNNVLEDHTDDFDEFIISFSIDDRGRLWVLTEDSIYEYENNIIFSKLPTPNDRCSKFFIDSQRTKWLFSQGTEGDAVHFYDNNAWKSYSIIEPILRFFEDSTGKIFFATSKRLGFVTDDLVQYELIAELYPEIASLSGSAKIWEFDVDEVWIESFAGIDKSRLYHYKDNQVAKYGMNEGYYGEYPESFQQDCEGNLFYTDREIIQKTKEEVWETFMPDYKTNRCSISGLQLNPYTCELWGFSDSSSTCRSLWKIKDDEIIEISILESYSYSLTFDDQGNVYYNDGSKLFIIDDIGLTEVVDYFDTNTNKCWYVYSARDASLWAIGVDEDGVDNIFNFKNDEWVAYNYQNSILPEAINYYWCYEDLKGNMWFGSDEGLIQFDGNDWNVFPLDLNIEERIIVSDMVEDPVGNYWISIWNQGLVYWDGLNITQFNILNSDIQSDFCRELELTDEYLWIRHVYGLSRMKLSDISSTQAPPAALPEPQFTLYPNPSAGPFHVKNETVAERRYEVYDIEGRLVLSETSDQEVWSGELEVGVYIVKVIEKDVQIAKKLFVSKM